MDEKKLRLALAIIAVEMRSPGDDWDTLGYDPYRFQGLGEPPSYEVRSKAIDIITTAIQEAHTRATEAESKVHGLLQERMG
jgi:hypothetical protein